MEIFAEHSPAATTPRFLGVNVVSTHQFQVVDVWLGLFKKGLLCPQQLLAEQNLSLLFKKAATEGILEERSIMLADTSLPEQPKKLFLIPDGDDCYRAIERAIDTIKSWKPSRVGVYVSTDNTDLFTEMVRLIITKTSVTDLSIIPGEIGYNAALNLAHSLRQDFQSTEIKLAVYH